MSPKRTIRDQEMGPPRQMIRGHGIILKQARTDQELLLSNYKSLNVLKATKDQTYMLSTYGK